jgi:ferredoxin-type protein NapH
MSGIWRNRYLLARRATQVSILILFALGAHLHLGVLTGDLSASRLFRTIPLADPFATLQILATGRTLESTVLLGAAIVLALWFALGGRGFCAWVCPVNIVSDATGWLGRRLGTRGQFRVDRSVRYWIAGLALGISAVMGIAAFEALSPIGMIQRGLIFGAGVGLFGAIAAIALLDLWVLRHGWCGSLCPLGAFWSIVGHRSLVRIGFDRERCDDCGDCLKICPEPQVIHFPEMEHKGFIDSGNCLNCARCLEVCPRDAFRFTVRRPARPQRAAFVRAA